MDFFYRRAKYFNLCSCYNGANVEWHLLHCQCLGWAGGDHGVAVAGIKSPPPAPGLIAPPSSHQETHYSNMEVDVTETS